MTHMDTGTHRDTQGRTGTHRDTHRHTEAHIDTQRHTDAHTHAHTARTHAYIHTRHT